MSARSPRRRLLRGLGVLSMIALGACAGSPASWQTPRPGHGAELERSALSGTALAQRSRDLDRAQATLGQFHTTINGLRHRKEGRNLEIFSDFVRAYFGLHLDPLLQSEWQSRSPELMARDASLRFAKADLLMRMRETSEVERVIDEIELRFRGRHEMLIDYPIGKQSTLREALEIVRGKQWWAL